MAPYIQLNTDIRARVTEMFEQDLFKLMNIAVFGKAMENLCKRIMVDTVRRCEIAMMCCLAADPA